MSSFVPTALIAGLVTPPTSQLEIIGRSPGLQAKLRLLTQQLFTD